MLMKKSGSVWKHKLIPLEISENNADYEIDLLIYKNHYVLIKKLTCIFRQK